jgi:hypothetical protein
VHRGSEVLNSKYNQSINLLLEHGLLLNSLSEEVVQDRKSRRFYKNLLVHDAVYHVVTNLESPITFLLWLYSDKLKVS